MHRNPFTDDDDCGNMDLLQAQHQAEEIFDYSTNEDIMATLKKETKATPAKSAPAKAPAPAAKATPAKTPAVKTAPAKVKGPRAVPDGFIGLVALATEFKTTPAAIRRKLRGSDLTRPEGSGWSFKEGSKDLTAVRKLLTAPEPKAAAK